MMANNSSILERFFYHWIKSFPMANEYKPDVIQIKSENKAAYITFVGDNLVELKIEEEEAIVFYLHFELTTVKDCSVHFQTFIDFLWNQTKVESNESYELCIHDTNIKDILFVCSGGWSSSYFAEEIDKELNHLNLDIRTAATPIENLKSIIDQYDIVLFAPQISYLVHPYQKEYGAKVMTISSYDFGTWNFKHILQQALQY